MEAEKYLGYWMEFIVNGRLPNGMNEEKTLHYVLKCTFSILKFVMGHQKANLLRDPCEVSNAKF